MRLATVCANAAQAARVLKVSAGKVDDGGRVAFVTICESIVDVVCKMASASFFCKSAGEAAKDVSVDITEVAPPIPKVENMVVARDVTLDVMFETNVCVCASSRRDTTSVDGSDCAAADVNSIILSRSPVKLSVSSFDTS